MLDALLAFGLGVVTGGLGLSICWGLFWLVIGTVGLVRGTCSRRVVWNSVVIGATPLLAIGALLWMGKGIQGNGAAFATGLSTMPLVLIGLGLRRAPDGHRAGIRMLHGMRHLTEELLGQHHACGGCSHAHEQHGPESGK